MAKKYWVGRTQCDICKRKDPPELYDAKTSRGTWALMCDFCWILLAQSLNLGVGIGQKYERQEDGRYLKTGG